MMKRVLALLLALALVAPALWADTPALVVFISVDQLRGDLPLQYKDRFGPDGFRRFYDHGTAYTNAHYGHVTTYTGCGHATLATGGNPREHGIVGNEWFDRATGKPVYCVADDDHKLLGVSSPSGGTSPKYLLAPTIGDALIEASGGKSKVFSISGKDRSGVLMAGHKSKAFWYYAGTGAFVTSDYYYAAYPAWVDRWNAADPADRYLGKSWDLSHPETEYVSPDLREVELPNPMIGGTFPHSFAGLDAKKLYAVLSVTPFSDELVIEFCKAAIENEKLGQRGSTDLLMVGLSATDIIGHQFGPESREQEDNLLRLDALLAGFFSYLDATVGKDKIVLALSADHGVDGNPGGKPSGQVDLVGLVNTADAALKEKFGAQDKYALGYKEPCLYFTPDVTERRAGELSKMEDAAAEALRKVEGVAYAIPAHDVKEGRLDASDPIMEMIKRSYREGLSGDVFVIQKEYYRVFSGKLPYTATHGSPYAYDTYVPVLFYGPGIPAQTLDAAVGPESIAATLAALMEIPAPSGATGPALKDVLAQAAVSK
jgi:predicted AlkP superfamily pyrophosphatase or phosphodiesterase